MGRPASIARIVTFPFALVARDRRSIAEPEPHAVEPRFGRQRIGDGGVQRGDP